MSRSGSSVGRRGQRPFPEFMAELRRSRATGVLTSSTGPGKAREILFVDGEIRAARSELESEKLGSWLVERGEITEDQRALTLLSQGSETAAPLGHLLTEKGLLEPQTLERELEELTLTIIHRAAADPLATYSFREGGIEDQPDTLPNMTTPQLLLEAARAYPETGRKLAALGAFDQVCWPNQPLESIVIEIELNTSEAYLLSRMDGSHRIADLESLAPMPKDQFVAALYTLKVAGLISLGDAGRKSALPMPALDHTPHGAGRMELVVDEDLLSEEQLAERRHVLELAGQVTTLDHYRALNLSPGADRLDIRTAWERLSKQYDPDRASEEHLRDLRAELQLLRERMEEAFEVLVDPVSRDRYDRVMRALQAGRSALDEDLHEQRLEAARRAREELIEANTQRAREFLREGEIYQAIQLLEQVCELDPTPQRLLELAKLLVRNPLWARRALEMLRRALAADPGLADAWIELAEFWRRRGNRERQRKSLERAIAADPDHERARVMYRQLMGERDLERLLRRARRR